MPFGVPGTCYAVVERDGAASTRWACVLHFRIVTVDPVTGDEGDAFEEEYPLEDLDVGPSDCLARTTVPDFRTAWEAVGSTHEALEKLALPYARLDAAVRGVLDGTGLQPCDGTGDVRGSPTKHMLHASGTYVGGSIVVVRAQIVLQDAGGVLVKIAVRCDDPTVPPAIIECIR